MSDEGKYPFEGTPELAGTFQNEHDKTQDTIDQENSHQEGNNQAQEYEELTLELKPDGIAYDPVPTSTFGYAEEENNTQERIELSLQNNKSKEFRDNDIQSDIDLKSDFNHAQEGDIE